MGIKYVSKDGRFQKWEHKPKRMKSGVYRVKNSDFIKQKQDDVLFGIGDVPCFTGVNKSVIPQLVLIYMRIPRNKGVFQYGKVLQKYNEITGSNITNQDIVVGYVVIDVGPTDLKGITDVLDGIYPQEMVDLRIGSEDRLLEALAYSKKNYFEALF